MAKLPTGTHRAVTPAALDGRSSLRASLVQLRESIDVVLSELDDGRAQQLITVERAAALVGRTPQCVRGWCRRYRHRNLGVPVRGQWLVDSVQLACILADRFGEERLPHELRRVLQR